MRGLSVHDLDSLVPNEPPQLERGTQRELGAWAHVDDANALDAGAMRERLVASRGDDAEMPAPNELARQEERLALPTTPAALGVHLEDSNGHGATSPAPGNKRKTSGFPHRILLVALDNLGDLVFASALAPPLREAFPSATIDIWCKRYTADVARLIPYVDNVIAEDPFWAVHPLHKRPAIGPFVRSLLDIRRRRYEIAILSEAPWRVAAAVAATRIPVRIGSVRHRNARFLTHILPAEDQNKPVIAEQARLLEPLGVESRDLRYRLDAAKLGDLRQVIAGILPERFAAMHPFASLARKRAPLELWLPVADALEGRGLPVLWIGTRAELDALRANHRPNALCIDHLHDGSLASTAAALALASLFVGHDSGPMHMAAAFGVPVVGVFVTGSPVRYGPQGVGPSRTLFAANPGDLVSDDIIRAIDSVTVASSA